jgi:hypothetical protein
VCLQLKNTAVAAFNFSCISATAAGSVSSYSREMARLASASRISCRVALASPVARSSCALDGGEAVNRAEILLVASAAVIPVGSNPVGMCEVRLCWNSSLGVKSLDGWLARSGPLSTIVSPVTKSASCSI